MSAPSALALGVNSSGLAEVCGRYGISRLELFGSRARGEATEGSDIDVLYDLSIGRHLGWEVDVLADELSALWGAQVDLTSRRALHPLIRATVESEARLLYGA